MSDAVLFIVLFGGLFVLRVIAATIVFLWILPDGNRCPNCDAETLRVESRGALKLLPWFRSSWCYECHWHGLHRIRKTIGCSQAEPVTPASGAIGALRMTTIKSRHRLK